MNEKHRDGGDDRSRLKRRVNAFRFLHSVATDNLPVSDEFNPSSSACSFCQRESIRHMLLAQRMGRIHRCESENGMAKSRGIQYG